MNCANVGFTVIRFGAYTISFNVQGLGMRPMSIRQFTCIALFGVSSALHAQVCPQSFDTVDVPALPPNWTSDQSGASTGWQTIQSADTPPNAAYTGEPGAVSDAFLIAPPFFASAANLNFSFRHSFATEANYDGGVLEVSIDGAPFADVSAVGGGFGTGGYNSVISPVQGSPIAGRQAWSGTSSGFITTSVLLPASALGKSVRVRWRFATDKNVGGTGWAVDSVACGTVVEPPDPADEIFRDGFETRLPGR